MGDSALLSLLSAIISAIITAAGAVIAAYINKDKGKNAALPRGKILRLEDQDSASPGLEFRKFLKPKSMAIIILALIVVGSSTRWLLGKYILRNIRLEFASSSDPTDLDPSLRWDAGNSELSAFTLDGDALTMTAGPYTWPNFPMVSYDRPLKGNFDVQVKVVFIPETRNLTTAQMVGLLVRPINARLVQSDASFPSDWVASAETITDAGSLVGCRGSWKDYSSNTVYLRLEREADSWRCAYSSNGKNWTWLNARVVDSQLSDKQLVVALFAYTITDNSISAEFSNWMISDGQR